MDKEDSNVALIREFFGEDRKVELSELRELSQEDRAQLGDMIRKTLGE